MEDIIMIYQYTNLQDNPTLSEIHKGVKGSPMSDKDIICCSYNGKGSLNITFVNELSNPDKILLDDIVESSLGVISIKKDDLDIMDEIFQMADSVDLDINNRTQQQRLLYVLDEKKSSFPLLVKSAVRSGTWDRVQGHVAGAVSEGVLLDEDQTLIFGILP